jgi:FkbM family methyltransferase
MRLADPGETAVDVGANIGYMARVLADRTGPAGTVFAFEPHPAMFAELLHNTENFGVIAKQAAVSDRAGKASLHVPHDFAGNHGIASLERPDSEFETLAINCLTLDEALNEQTTVGVLKIDIEGHELAALSGAQAMLRAGRIRDIVFEEHNPRNSAVAAHLTEMGYAVFRLEKRFGGPRLVSPTSIVVHNGWESPAFLATIAPDRAQARMRQGGWCALAD